MSGDEEHLSRIDTIWTEVHRAHGDDRGEAQDAMKTVLRAYSGAVYRYLMVLLRNRDAADEVFQRFALAVVEGRFKHADAHKGRFRDYLKTSIIRLAREYQRSQGNSPRPLADETLAALPQHADGEPDFDASYRDDLLASTWARLKGEAEASYRVLHYRAQHPEATGKQIAQALSGPDENLTATSVRKALQRARQRFGELLLKQTAEGKPPDFDAQAELNDLGLAEFL